MSLKKDIIIKNEFSILKNEKATRGRTVGNYVIRYMMRKSACENLSPVQFKDIENFQLRYMMREDATERAYYKGELKDSFDKMQGLSSIGFSKNNISLSDKEARFIAKKIQKSFDDGHMVQKIVLSFTENFLKNTGIVDKNFVFKGRGSYKGNIDQLKLRSAIQSGINSMLRVGHFAEGEYIGVIQVDTAHVHCHLACTDLSDNSPRVRKKDGEQRGLINEKEKVQIRRGIANELKLLEKQKSFKKQVDLERQNVVSFVKNFSYNKINDSSSFQLLLASLPKDKSLWRYSSNALVMKRANEIAKGIVINVFDKYPEKSGYNKVLSDIKRYAKEKSKETGKNPYTYISNGKDKLYERSVNGIYKVLKSLNLSGKEKVDTVMIDIAKRSTEELIPIQNGKPFDMASFELKIRGYNKRRDYHLEKYDFYRKLIHDYDSKKHSQDSMVIRDFYEVEMLYHQMTCDKYRHFLAFKNKKDNKISKDLEDYVQNIVMKQDELNKQFALLENIKMLSELSDEEVLYKFGIDRKDYLNKYNRNVIERNLKREIRNLEKRIFSLEERAYLMGYRIMNSEGYLVKPVKEPIYAFDDVRALDLHDLSFDFPKGAKVSDNNVEKFIDMVGLRDEALKDALSYIKNTNQDVHIFDEVYYEIEDMKDLAKRLAIKKELEAIRFNTVDIEEREETGKITDFPSESEVIRKIVSEIREDDLDVDD